MTASCGNIIKGGWKMSLEQNSLSRGEIGEKVLSLSVAGVPFHEIEKSLVADGADPDRVLGAYRETLEHFRRMANPDIDLERGQASERLHMLFLSAMKIQDYKTALAVQKELNKLTRLYDRPAVAAPLRVVEVARDEVADPAPAPVIEEEEDDDELTLRLLG